MCCILFYRYTVVKHIVTETIGNFEPELSTICQAWALSCAPPPSISVSPSFGGEAYDPVNFGRDAGSHHPLPSSSITRVLISLSVLSPTTFRE